MDEYVQQDLRASGSRDAADVSDVPTRDENPVLELIAFLWRTKTAAWTRRWKCRSQAGSGLIGTSW